MHDNATRNIKVYNNNNNSNYNNKNNNNVLISLFIDDDNTLLTWLTLHTSITSITCFNSCKLAQKLTRHMLFLWFQCTINKVSLIRDVAQNAVLEKKDS